MTPDQGSGPFHFFEGNTDLLRAGWGDPIVPYVPREDVDMDVRHSLKAHYAVVLKDVEAVRIERPTHGACHPDHVGHERCSFVFAHVEDRRDMTLGNH